MLSKMLLVFRIISNYIAWVTLEDVIRHLPDEYSDARLAYQKRIHGDAFDDSERWDFCYEDTKNAFPFSIGLMFVDEKLGPQARERVDCSAYCCVINLLSCLLDVQSPTKLFLRIIQNLIILRQFNNLVSQSVHNLIVLSG
jgi:hypothetical protein